MTKSEIQTALETLQNRLTNLKIFIAVPMAVLMGLYFFTYSTLIDMGYQGVFYFEIISSAIFFLILFNLNRVGYKFLQLLLARRKRYRPLFQKLDAKSINDPLEQLTERLARELSAE